MILFCAEIAASVLYVWQSCSLAHDYISVDAVVRNVGGAVLRIASLAQYFLLNGLKMDGLTTRTGFTHPRYARQEPGSAVAAAAAARCSATLPIRSSRNHTSNQALTSSSST